MSDKSDKPCCEDVVNELITNTRTKYTEEDREWLLTLKEDQVAKLVPEPAKKPVEKPPEKKEPTPQLNAEQAREIVKESLKTNEDFFNFMPEDLREQMRSGLKLHQEQKSKRVNLFGRGSIHEERRRRDSHELPLGRCHRDRGSCHHQNGTYDI